MFIPSSGKNNGEIARILDISLDMARLWRNLKLGDRSQPSGDIVNFCLIITLLLFKLFPIYFFN